MSHYIASCFSRYHVYLLPCTQKPTLNDYQNNFKIIGCLPCNISQKQTFAGFQRRGQKLKQMSEGIHQLQQRSIIRYVACSGFRCCLSFHFFVIRLGVGGKYSLFFLFVLIWSAVSLSLGQCMYGCMQQQPPCAPVNCSVSDQ